MAATWRSMMAKAGFLVESTGGNCEWYIRRASDGFEEVVVIDASLPTSKADDVTIGTFPHGYERCSDVFTGGDEDCWECGYTFGEVLRALAHPSEEYHLLTLRLANGLGGGQQEFTAEDLRR